MKPVRRVARKRHYCGGCDGFVQVGEVYLEHTLFPGNDVIEIDHPIRGAECTRCATRYGRGDLVALAPCCDCCLSNSNHGPETAHARLCSNPDHREAA